MKILGIESTCDETGVAVVEDGRKILSNIIASSVEIQKRYGGVVPEIAAREQIKAIIPTLNAALEGMTNQDLDLIAVSSGPGLVGSLLVGVETAKALSAAWKKPLVPINHLIAHLYACWADNSKNLPSWPAIGLIVSGGHTDLILMKNHGKYLWLGGTLDDAAGEAFDKVARILGLSYPGGPEIERIARNFKFQILNFKLPRPLINSDDFDFSFSGLKTAVYNLVRKTTLSNQEISAIAYEFQEAITDVLSFKTLRACADFGAKSIIIGGGVAANLRLRQKISSLAANKNLAVFFPPVNLSVDNGAMIAIAAYYDFKPKDIRLVKSQPNLYFA